MRVSYLTTDEVNRDLALQLAEACGVTLQPLTPRDLPQDGPGDAVLYDLDFLPAAHRQEVLAALAAGAMSCPAGVHSYSLDGAVAAALRKQTVVVSARLDRRLIQNLRRLAARRERQSMNKAAVTH